MDLTTYVRTNILPYLEQDQDGEYIMPDLDNDIEYFSGLHSWYKHWRGEAPKVYPILKLGREPRNSFDQNKNKKDKLHWRFIIDRPDSDKFTIEWWELMREEFPIDMMKKHHVHLSSQFYNQSSELYKFHHLALTTECLSIWKEIKSLLNDLK